VKRLGYGNQDLSGDAGQNNGLTAAWLSSSLLISSEQQAAFLEKLIVDQLPVGLDAHRKTRNILFREVLHKGWKLYGKTGSGRQLDAQGHKTDLQHGWFVGWITKNERTIVFVYHKADREKMTDYVSHRAKQAAKDQLINLIDHLEADTATEPTKPAETTEQ
jgi:beta-lactamase class D